MLDASDNLRMLELDAITQGVEDGSIERDELDAYIAEALSRCHQCRDCARGHACAKPLGISVGLIEGWRCAALVGTEMRILAELDARLPQLSPWARRDVAELLEHLWGWKVHPALDRGRPEGSKYSLRDIERRITTALETRRARGDPRANRTAAMEDVAAYFKIQPKSLAGQISKLKAKS